MINTHEKLHSYPICFRYLATGDSYKSIGYNYRMGDRTVSKIVCQVSTAVWKNMQPIYPPEPTLGQWEEVACEFERKWHFPHCLGSIDGKHVSIMKPANNGSSFFNYKQPFSIVLMATVDSDYKLITVDVGSMGRFSDGKVFSNRALARKIQNKSVLLPTPKPLPGIENDVPYVFIW